MKIVAVGGTGLIRSKLMSRLSAAATQFFEFVPSMADAATDGRRVRFAPVQSG